MSRLYVHGCGAVTPVGLAYAPTCAAIRASIARIEDEVPIVPSGAHVKGARVKASQSLRSTSSRWLVNLATKALLECLESLGAFPGPVPLFVCLPEAFRQHPAQARWRRGEFLALVQNEAGIRLHADSTEIDTGTAGIMQGLQVAAQWLSRGGGSLCVVGGVDTLLNDSDIGRLRRDGRLHEEGNPQGVLPGEGAAFFAVSLSTHGALYLPLAALTGIGLAKEKNAATGERYSVGEGLTAAVVGAFSESQSTREEDVSFVVSDNNGERYAAWEASFAHARIYRTRRERLEVVHFVGSVGDIGVAKGALSVIVASTAIAQGYASGPIAVCEASSEEGLRGACVVGPPPYFPAYAGPGARRKAGGQ